MKLPEDGPRPAGLSRARRSMRVLFMALGFLSGAWAVHVPSAKAHYQLSAGGLSWALLAAALGAVLVLTRAAQVVQAHGPRRVVGAAMAMACGSVALVLMPWGAWAGAADGLQPPLVRLGVLPLLMFLMGVGTALFDVAINTEASTLEKLSRRPVMSGFHGMWSLGGMAGAGVAALMLRLQVAPLLQLVLMAAAALAMALLARPAMLGDAARAAAEPSAGDGVAHAASGAAGAHAAAPAAPSPAASAHAAPAGSAAPAAPSVWRNGLLMLLGGLGTVGLMAEGAVYDWIVLWLQQDLAMSPALAALGYGGFAAAMAGNRLAGDWLRQRIAPRPLLTGCGLIAALAMALALLSRQPVVALVALVVVGASLANLVPVIMMAASHVPGVPPAAGIAAVSAVGYSGFVAGPPLIGALADAFSLTTALWVVVAALLVQAIGARWLPR